MTKRPQTRAAGSDLERQYIRNWARRNTVTRESLLAYLDGRTKRDRKGGVGRK